MKKLITIIKYIFKKNIFINIYYISNKRIN